MNEGVILGLMREALTVGMLVGAPILGTTLVVGMVVSIIQAATQVNEATLTFVPKLIAVFVAMLLFGMALWMMSTLLDFSAGIFANMAAYGR
ncbi:flagellar biosynthesis protein FliQ [Tepidiforma flava]|uniref:Flagellar biosynthetic protein FliQ n=1 Tax=Tepidiforma flava TaxID=3004094 RepID=A0ABY7M4A3_9CHLR|nr:flagellar biosynthesis protein FliQ [Tepidiforma flava]WBL34992.1 flagellar biosynthesis protein FliQ [Tepidiforma flava]